MPAPGAPGAYRPPVDAPVVDRFRPPQHRYGPGNRGIDYGTRPDTPVVAPAAGEVQFAGAVADDLHVVLLHPDGLRTSLSFLGSVRVRRGERVDAGAVVGHTGTAPLHFGVRRGDVYLDPEALLAGRLHGVRLVPVPFAAVDRDDPAGVVGRLVEGTAGALARRLADRARLAARSADLVQPGRRLAEVAATVAHRRTRPCTPRRVAVHPGDGAAAGAPALTDRVVVLVAGLGSTSTRDAGVDRVDPQAVGWDPAAVVRFSYGGGVVAAPPGTAVAADLADLPTSTYTTHDSQQGVEAPAAALAALVADIRRARPGAAVDLVGHSQGGLVAVAAARLVGAADGALRVVTIATPHDGATLATALQQVADEPGRAQVLGALADLGVGGGLHHDSPSAADLAKTSAFVAGHRSAGVPVPVVSIAGRWDPVVPSSDAVLPGATTVVVDGPASPLAHDLLPGHPDVLREVALAVRGRPATCEGFLDTLGDVAVGHALADAVDLAALAAS